MDKNETRATSSTGASKGRKPTQMFWLDAGALTQLGNVAGFGAAKYAPHNYRKGYNLSDTMNALHRHLLLFQEGEDNDPESGLPHMAHAMWHCMNAMALMRDHPEFDDRWNAEEQEPNNEVEAPRERFQMPEFDEVDTTVREMVRRRQNYVNGRVPDIEGRDVRVENSDDAAERRAFENDTFGK